MLPLITVTLMLHVPTFLGASPVCVTKVTLEMEPLAMVSYREIPYLYNCSLQAGYLFSLFFFLGPPSSPTILSTSPQSTSITLTWSQPSMDVVDSYQISYSFTIRGCGTTMPTIVVSAAGSSREYFLTRLEENSDFTISITAMNGAGSSSPTITTTRTAIAGT